MRNHKYPAIKYLLLIPALVILLIPCLSCTHNPANRALNNTIEKGIVKTIEKNLPKVTVFKFTPPVVCDGDNTTLTWIVEQADNVTIDGGIGSVKATGTRPLALTANAVYTLTAINGLGTVTEKATISFVPANTLPKIKSFSLMKSSSGTGGFLTWSAVDATKITVEPKDGMIPNNDNSVFVRPKSTTIYVLTASNKYGSVSENCTVEVKTPADNATTK
jgi:hypothetical protein